MVFILWFFFSRSNLMHSGLWGHLLLILQSSSSFPRESWRLILIRRKWSEFSCYGLYPNRSESMSVIVLLTRDFLQLTAGVKITDYCWAERPSYESLECGVWDPLKHYALQRRIQDKVAFYRTLNTWPWYNNNGNYHTNTLVLLYPALRVYKEFSHVVSKPMLRAMIPKRPPNGMSPVGCYITLHFKGFPLFSTSLWQIAPQEG